MALQSHRRQGRLELPPDRTAHGVSLTQARLSLKDAAADFSHACQKWRAATVAMRTVAGEMQVQRRTTPASALLQARGDAGDQEGKEAAGLTFCRRDTTYNGRKRRNGKGDAMSAL